MREERLLERLVSLEQQPLRRERNQHGRLVESILAHLHCILNTRHGGVPIAPEYGVPDFLNFLQRYPDSVREIECSIREAIELYEPRLELVQVSFIPHHDEALSLRFQIEAQVREASVAPVSFHTVVETDGKVSIRR